MGVVVEISVFTCLPCNVKSELAKVLTCHPNVLWICVFLCFPPDEVQSFPPPPSRRLVWLDLQWNLLSHACVSLLSLFHSNVCPPTGQCPNGLSCFPSLSLCKYSGSSLRSHQNQVWAQTSLTPSTCDTFLHWHQTLNRCRDQPVLHVQCRDASS